MHAGVHKSQPSGRCGVVCLYGGVYYLFIRSVELASCHLSEAQKSYMAVRFLENSRAPDCRSMEQKEIEFVTEVQLNVHNTCDNISKPVRPINAMHNWPAYKFALFTLLIIQRNENRNSDFAFGILS